MIYTLTFNPALDYIVKVSDYKEGMVNRTSSETLLPGGKGINVSMILSHLSTENIALGFVGGFTGTELETLLENEKVQTDFVRLTNGNTRINVKLKADCETEINAAGPKISKAELNMLYKKLNELKDDDFLVLAGSIPSSLPDSIYCQIAQNLSGKKINFVVDAEKNLLKDFLKFKPFLIKPNHHELGDFFNKKLESKEEIACAARKLQEMGARNVFVSMADKGGILACENNEVFFSVAPSGNVINSTGAGDSLLGGFLSEYISSKDYKKAFIMGLCAGSASAFSQNLATKDEIEKIHSFFSKNQIKNLI